MYLNGAITCAGMIFPFVRILKSARNQKSSFNPDYNFNITSLTQAAKYFMN